MEVVGNPHHRPYPCPDLPCFSDSRLAGQPITRSLGQCMNLTKHWAAQLDDYVIDLAWSADGALLAAAASSGPLSLFTATDGNRTNLPGHDDGTNCIAWHPARALLASGGQDAKVKFWDAASAQHSATAHLNGAWVEHLCWSPDGTKLAAAAGRQLTLLNPDGSPLHAFPPAPKTLVALAWQPAGDCLASAYFGGVCLWDPHDLVTQKEFPYANGIHALVWSPDNRWLVSGNQDPSVHLWLVEEEQEFHMSGYETKVKTLTFNHNSRQLATSGGNAVCIWDCEGVGPEGREPDMLPHDTKICALAFQNTHGLLASASEDGVLQLWSPERPNPLRATVKMPAAATKLAWSPDDTLLAVGSAAGIVYVLKLSI